MNIKMIKFKRGLNLLHTDYIDIKIIMKLEAEITVLNMVIE